MIIHSQWRVKAAINLAFFFAIHFADAQSISKDPFQKNISITGQNVSFEEILQQLSMQTRLYFIYSSNSVELNRSLTLNLNQRPLYEVLETLGKMMNLAFRREGNYVVVKPAAVNPAESSPVRKPKPFALPTLKTEYATLDNPVKKYREIDHRLFIPYDLLTKNLLYCTSDFSGIDTFQVKKYLPLNITNPHPKRVVFTSLGLMANEYYGGIEIRMGIPSLYGVFNTGLMHEGYFRYGYGLGTSIPIKPMVRLNPVYTFASLRQEQDYVVNEFRNLVMKDGLKLEGKHHQLKFLFEIEAFKRIRFHVGPSVNFLKTSYAFGKGTMLYSDITTVNTATSSSSGYYAGSSQVGIIKSVYFTPPSNYNTNKTWVGFEAGISYVIKFPHP
jgi:hypothetical protein